MSEESTPPTPATPPPSKKKAVTVQAKVRLHEDGVSYEPGDKFKTTPERAEALGQCVESA